MPSENLTVSLLLIHCESTLIKHFLTRNLKKPNRQNESRLRTERLKAEQKKRQKVELVENEKSKWRIEIFENHFSSTKIIFAVELN